MTRDNFLWVIGIIAGVALAAAGHFDKIQEAFPAITPIWQARLELAGWGFGLLSAKLSMSPLKLSEDGKLAAKAGKL